MIIYDDLSTYVSSANSENNKVQQKMLEVFGESTQEMLNLIKSRCSNDEKKSLDKRLVHKHNHELGIESGDKRTIHMFLKQGYSNHYSSWLLLAIVRGKWRIEEK